MEETGRFAVETDLQIARDRAQPGRPRVRPGIPARRLHLPHPLGDPAQRGPRVERRGVRRGADGRRPPLRARRRRARAWPPSSRAIPTTSRPRCTAGSSICADGEATRFDPPAGPRGGRRRAALRRCARRPRARRCPREVPMADAVFNTAHGALLVARPRARRLGPRRPRSRRPPAPAAPRAPVPALDGARPRRALVRRAGGDDLGRRPDRARVVPLRDDRRASSRPCAARPRAGPRSCGCPSSPRAPTCASSERRLRRRPLRHGSQRRCSRRTRAPRSIARALPRAVDCARTPGARREPQRPRISSARRT